MRDKQSHITFTLEILELAGSVQAAALFDYLRIEKSEQWKEQFQHSYLDCELELKLSRTTQIGLIMHLQKVGLISCIHHKDKTYYRIGGIEI